MTMIAEPEFRPVMEVVQEAVDVLSAEGFIPSDAEATDEYHTVGGGGEEGGQILTFPNGDELRVEIRREAPADDA
jgi:hypothetical protein